MNFFARAVLFLTGLGLVIYSVHRYEAGHPQTQVIYITSPAPASPQPQPEQPPLALSEQAAPSAEPAPDQLCDGCTAVSAESDSAQPAEATEPSSVPSSPQTVQSADVPTAPAPAPPPPAPPANQTYSQPAAPPGYQPGLVWTTPSSNPLFEAPRYGSPGQAIRPTTNPPYHYRFPQQSAPAGRPGYGGTPPHRHRR